MDQIGDYARRLLQSGWAIAGALMALVDLIIWFVLPERFKERIAIYVRRSWVAVAILIVVAQAAVYFALKTETTQQTRRISDDLRDEKGKRKELEDRLAAIRPVDTSNLQFQLEQAKAHERDLLARISALEGQLDTRARLNAASTDIAKLIPQWRELISRCGKNEPIDEAAEKLFLESLNVVRKNLGEAYAQRFISAPYPHFTRPAEACKLYTVVVAKETALNEFNKEIAAKSP
jgi:hypothetical protein